MAFLDIDSLSHARMVRLEDERRFRNLAILSICSFVLPIAAGLHGGVFVWDLLPTATVTEMLRLFSPVFLGIGLLILSFSHRLDRLVSGLIALTLLIVCAIFFTESDLAYTDLFTGMIGYVGRRPLVVLMGLSHIAIGADLRNKAMAGQLIEEEELPTEREDSTLIVKVANGALLFGAVLLVVLYVLPILFCGRVWVIIWHKFVALCGRSDNQLVR